MLIPKVEESVYDAAETSLKELLDAMIQSVGRSTNWKARKKTFVDILIELQILFDIDPKNLTRENLAEMGFDLTDVEAVAAAETEPEDPGEADEDPGVEDMVAPDPADGPGGFPAVLPLYVGAVLERLDEDRIHCVEQAALYLLSVHNVHQDAARLWLESDQRNVKAYRKLMRADRRYAGIMTMMEAFIDQLEKTGHFSAPWGGADGPVA